MRFIPRFSITNTITAALTEIERALRFLDAASLRLSFGQVCFDHASEAF